MDHDQEKVDEVVLALMYLTLHDQRHGIGSAWKGYDWSVLDRLHEKGWIDNPKNRAKSVVMTKEGLTRSKALFETHFGIPPRESSKEARAARGDRGRLEALLSRVPDVEPDEDDRL
jgi:hypothetical protein